MCLFLHYVPNSHGVSLLQACPEFTTTPDAHPEVLALHGSDYTALVSPMVFTSSANCSNLPGYGWAHGVASECPEGRFTARAIVTLCLQWPCAKTAYVQLLSWFVHACTACAKLQQHPDHLHVCIKAVGMYHSVVLDHAVAEKGCFASSKFCY